jgi:hypothetical protein
MADDYAFRSGSGDADSLLTTAFSLHANPGAYALLIGAGVSHPSGIPTAWGVLTDLCTRMASVEGHDLAGEDSAEWYTRTQGAEPTYGRLLETLAPTPTLRQALLAEYFDPTPVEVEEGRKGPTAAHHAIARLVADGVVRIIITLNFDRLIEQALRAAGIEPTVISHPSEVEGMRPLHQLDCCVIHLHGDYKAPDSMLNTDEELAGYQPAIDALLGRILDDYGLIVAGWSAAYDPALRASIASHHNVARYPLVWIAPHALTEEGRQLVDLKRGTVLHRTADAAFGPLSDAVEALRTRSAAHPLTVPIAVETAKRELSGRAVAVRVHDVLARAFTDLHQMPAFRYTQDAQATEAGGYLKVLERIEEAVRLPAALVATLTYWGDAKTDRWWLPELERFSYRSQGGGDTRYLEVRRVAGVWLFYAAGVSAVLAGRWDLIAVMFRTQVPHHTRFNERQPLCEFYEPGYNYKAPQHSDGFYDSIAPLLMEALAVGPEALEEAWQTFELARLATQITGNHAFDEARAAHTKAENILDAAEEAYQATRSVTGGDSGTSQTERHEAWHVAGKALGALVRMAHYLDIHVLTADRMNPDDKHSVPQALRLIADLKLEQDAHPMIAGGLADNWQDLATAIRAVSHGLGTRGDELAWARLPPGTAGSIPMTMWLDSKRTADERGTDTLPA